MLSDVIYNVLIDYGYMVIKSDPKVDYCSRLFVYQADYRYDIILQSTEVIVWCINAKTYVGGKPLTISVSDPTIMDRIKSRLGKPNRKKL